MMAPNDKVKENTPEAFDYYWSKINIHDYQDSSRDELNAKIVQWAENDRPSSVLDVGCGPGLLLSRLLVSRLYGVDFSAAAIELAKKRVPRASFVICDAAAIPHNDNSFDCVICAETLEHVLDPRRVANELLRITKPSGTIIIAVPNGNIDRWDGHRHFFTLSTMVQLFGYNTTLDYTTNDFILVKFVK